MISILTRGQGQVRRGTEKVQLPLRLDQGQGRGSRTGDSKQAGRSSSSSSSSEGEREEVGGGRGGGGGVDEGRLATSQTKRWTSSVRRRASPRSSASELSII